MSSAGGLSAGLIGAVMTTAVFAIMTPTAKSPLPGVIVYGDSGIKGALLAIAGVTLVSLVAAVIFLRQRNGGEADTLATATTQQTSATV